MQVDVGIAIGTGTDIAIESADAILLGERLGGVVDAYHIGKNSFRKTVQNVTLAFSFNGIGVPLAVTGLVHPVMAMVAMAGSVTAVLLNSFDGRLLPKGKAPTKEEFHELTLEVPTIHCEGCVENVKDAILGIRGVETIEVDLAHRLVTVTSRDGGSIEGDVRDRVTEAGHAVA